MGKAPSVGSSQPPEPGALGRSRPGQPRTPCQIVALPMWMHDPCQLTRFPIPLRSVRKQTRIPARPEPTCHPMRQIAGGGAIESRPVRVQILSQNQYVAPNDAKSRSATLVCSPAGTGAVLPDSRARPGRGLDLPTHSAARSREPPCGEIRARRWVRLRARLVPHRGVRRAWPTSSPC